jgi:Tol biopolymer transport system component
VPRAEPSRATASASLALRRRMSHLLLLVVALPLVASADVGHAARKEFNVDIIAVNLAGRQTNLTRNPAWDSAPAVSRDGRIVFLSTRGGTPDLYVTDSDGGDVRRLTNSAVDHSGVAWGETSSSARRHGRRGAGRSRSTASTARLGRPVSSTARTGTCSSSDQTEAG